MNAPDASRAHFVETIGLLFEAETAPRISGRILGFLVLASGGYSLDDLTGALQVSKGSISTNARGPTDPKVIRRLQNLNDGYLKVITSMKQDLEQLRSTHPTTQRALAAEER